MAYALRGHSSAAATPKPTPVASASATPTAAASATPTSSASAVADFCAKAPQPPTKPMQFSAEPPLTVTKGAYLATMMTNCGEIQFLMNASKTPHTVNSFAFLAGKGYFTDSPCHRLTTSGIYVLQCGDPTGTGTGGPGYTIPDENLAGATYPAGTVAMANTGKPHSGGSQFFLVYKDTSLPPSYTPFGKIVKGLAILQRIAAAGVNPNGENGPGDGHPNDAVSITSFTVSKV
jgi:peptidyl-prolyl cis-trans isomerase B (cyclophilin B)